MMKLTKYGAMIALLTGLGLIALFAVRHYEITRSHPGAKVSYRWTPTPRKHSGGLP